MRIGLQRHGGEHSDGGGERSGDAPVRGVEGRVGVGQGDSMTNETMNGPALGVGGGDVVGAAQVEGVVGDDHIDAALDGLIDDRGDRIDSEEHRAGRVRRVAADELIGVPGLGELGRGRRTKHADDVGDGRGRVGGRTGVLRGDRLDAGGGGSEIGLAHE